MRSLAVVTFILVALSPGLAHADHEERWPIWSLAPDALADTVLIAGVASGSNEIAVGGLLIVGLATPVAFGLHEISDPKSHKGLSSFVRRLVVGGLGCAGGTIYDHAEKTGDHTGLYVGCGAGIVSMQAFDAWFSARTLVHDPDLPPQDDTGVSMLVGPRFVGVSGRF